MCHQPLHLPKSGSGQPPTRTTPLAFNTQGRSRCRHASAGRTALHRCSTLPKYWQVPHIWDSTLSPGNFYHPADRVGQSSAEAVSRFFEDQCRFPPSAYEEQSLVWRQHNWRTPSPAERCQAMGIPPSAVSAVGGFNPGSGKLRTPSSATASISPRC